jgi:hypothetical protein
MAERTTTVESEESDDADDESLDRLAERYQTEQVLDSSPGIEATITDAGWHDSADIQGVCLHLSIPGGTTYPVVLSNLANGEPGDDFLSLLHWLEQPVQVDLSAVEGETVGIEVTSEEGVEFVQINTGNGEVRARIVDDSAVVTSAQATLPADIVDDLTRADRYRRAEGNGRSVGIVDLSATDSEIVVQLTEGWGTIRVPVERAHESTPQTAYERLVEHVGGGSVRQIAGGSIHLVHASDVPDTLTTSFAELDEEKRAALYDGYITTTIDRAGEWAVFVTKPRTGGLSILPDRRPLSEWAAYAGGVVLFLLLYGLGAVFDMLALLYLSVPVLLLTVWLFGR